MSTQFPSRSAESEENEVAFTSRGEEPSETKVRILLAAEKLFGERGIDGVSLRQIRMAAGQANNSAVHYHFEDRGDIVRAILAYRVAQMEPERAAMLASLKASDELHDVAKLLRILCVPQVSLVDEDGRHPFIRFSTEYLIRHRALGIDHPGDTEESAPALFEVMQLLYEALFFLDRDIALFRVTGAVLLFLSLVAQHDVGLGFAGEKPSIDLVIDEAVAMAAAALTVPPTALLKNRYRKG